MTLLRASEKINPELLTGLLRGELIPDAGSGKVLLVSLAPCKPAPLELPPLPTGNWCCPWVPRPSLLRDGLNFTASAPEVGVRHWKWCSQSMDREDALCPWESSPPPGPLASSESRQGTAHTFQRTAVVLGGLCTLHTYPPRTEMS